MAMLNNQRVYCMYVFSILIYIYNYIYMSLYNKFNNI